MFGRLVLILLLSLLFVCLFVACCLAGWLVVVVFIVAVVVLGGCLSVCLLLFCSFFHLLCVLFYRVSELRQSTMHKTIYIYFYLFLIQRRFLELDCIWVHWKQ